MRYDFGWRWPYVFLVVVPFVAGGVTAQIPEVDSLHYGYDRSRAFFLLRLDHNTVEYPVTGFRAGTQVLSLLEPVGNLHYDSLYTVVTENLDTARLGLTRLPLITLTTPNRLSRLSKSEGRLSYADDHQTISSDMGVRHRGSFSLRFPKKSLDIEFWDNPETRSTRDVRFGDLRLDDDWVLDALYNEPLRVNAYVAHKLWLDLHTPYYHDREDEARSGADVMFVEVFEDGRYQGVFLLSEQVDRKQLKLKKTKDGAVRGELYKAVDWTESTKLIGQGPLPAPAAERYDGWELKYPEPEDSLGWEQLHHLVGVASTSSESDFARFVETYFELDNVVDYFLYVNALTLVDNTGKNTYLARYREGEPYFYVPWDLDASFGNRHDGTKYHSPDVWLTNGLQRRLLALGPANYRERFCDRYRELRSGVLDPTEITGRIRKAVAQLTENGVLGREAWIWPGSVDYSLEYLSYVEDWNHQRAAMLDERVCAEPVATQRYPSRVAVRIFPNPAADHLTLERDRSDEIDYVLFDLTGRAIRRGTISGLRSRIDLTGLAAGMYALRIGDAIRQIVIQP